MSKYLIKITQNITNFKENFTWDRTGGDPIKQGNRNFVVKNVGVDGVKTGYLAVEKYSLASSMKKDRRLIAVVSGFATKFKKFYSPSY